MQNASGLCGRTLGVSAAVHVALFVFLWVLSLVLAKTPETIIPIDMTIVPPWAEQDPNDPDPDPNPPPKEQPKPAVQKPAPKPVEPPKVDKGVDAVERIQEKPKPKKKEFKKAELKDAAKDPPKKADKPFKKAEVKIAKPPPPVSLPPGKGTSRDKPLSQAEIEKALAAGARFGASNQLPANEAQRCMSLVERRLQECWTDFNWHEGLKPVGLRLKFGAGGRISGYAIINSSGDPKVDQSVLAAAKRAERVGGLSADFLRDHQEVLVWMEPTR